MKQKLFSFILFATCIVVNMQGQNNQVTGTVTTISDKAPLPGVNILVISTERGTQTDFDGNYAINASSGDVLRCTYLGLGSVMEIGIEEGHTTLNTNFNAFFYLCKHAIPHIKKQKGTIIANASIAAFKCFPNHPIFCASKAALVALVKQIALDYGPEIHVNVICPGPVDTPLIWDSGKAFENPEKAVDNVKDATLLQRLGIPEGIAK